MWSIKEIKQKGKKTLKNNLWTLLLIGLFMTIVVGKYAVNNDSLSNLNVLKQFIEDRKNGKELTWIDKENPEVIHAIEAHHGDVEPRTIIACLVQAADAISAARPGARRENVENYIKRLQKLEEIANSFDGVEKCYAIQAGREIRILVKPEVVKDDQTVLVAREIAKKIESELDYPGQVKVHVVRESRAIEYAK